MTNALVIALQILSELGLPVFPCREKSYATGRGVNSPYTRNGNKTPNDTATVRSVFIIGPDKQLKLSMTYPMTVGRNFVEVIRALDALQLSTSKGGATPADWLADQDVIIPVAVNDEEAESRFGGFEKRLPYLRTVNRG